MAANRVLQTLQTKVRSKEECLGAQVSPKASSTTVCSLGAGAQPAPLSLFDPTPACSTW
jgi:hypothetical protein